MNVNLSQVRSFFVQTANEGKNVNPKTLGLIGAVVGCIGIYILDKMNQNNLITAYRTFEESYRIRTDKDKVTPNVKTECQIKYDNLTRVTAEYQKIYDNLGLIRSWFSGGQAHLEKANTLIKNASLTILADAKRKKQTENAKMIRILKSKGCDYRAACFLVSKVTDKEMTSAALFAEGLKKTFASGAATFVEEEFVGIDNKIVAAGWHDAKFVAAKAAPTASYKAKAEEVSKTTTDIVKELKQKRVAEGMVRSIPAFSNEYDRLTSTDKPVKIFDPILGKNIEMRNSEIVFRYQKFIVMYCEADSIPSKKDRRSKMEEIADTAKKVLKFYRDEKLVAERSPYCIMTGCGEGKESEKKSPVWEKVKVLAMKRTVEAKLKSRPDLVLKLLLTDDKDCLTFITEDDVWGTGLDGKGQDLLAKLYEQKRTDLRKLDRKGLTDWFESQTGDDKVTTYVPLNLN